MVGPLIWNINCILGEACLILKMGRPIFSYSPNTNVIPTLVQGPPKFVICKTSFSTWTWISIFKNQLILYQPHVNLLIKISIKIFDSNWAFRKARRTISKSRKIILAILVNLKTVNYFVNLKTGSYFVCVKS